MLNKEIYNEKIRPFRVELDIDRPPFISVTKESNGYAVWDYTDQEGTRLLKYFDNIRGKTDAIRFAIIKIDEWRAALKAELEKERGE